MSARKLTEITVKLATLAMICGGCSGGGSATDAYTFSTTQPQVFNEIRAGQVVPSLQNIKIKTAFAFISSCGCSIGNTSISSVAATCFQGPITIVELSEKVPSKPWPPRIKEIVKFNHSGFEVAGTPIANTFVIVAPGGIIKEVIYGIDLFKSYKG